MNTVENHSVDVPEKGFSPEATISEYTEAEIKEAQIETESLRRDLSMVGRMTYTVAERLSAFSKKEYHYRLGFETMDEFLNSLGYAPSTYNKYLRVYKVLTGELGIPREKYETLDVGKSVEIEHLATKINRYIDMPKDKKRMAIEAAIQESWDLSISDVIESNEQKITRLSAGKPLDGEISEGSKGDIQESPLEYLESGVFKLVRISKEERDGDPRVNRELVKVNGTRAKVWFNNKTKLFTVEIP